VKSWAPDKFPNPHGEENFSPLAHRMREALRFSFETDSDLANPRDLSFNDYDMRLVMAVSGGSDSMAMLALAQEIAALDCGLTLMAVTVDHGLRPEAAAEARYVGKVCAEMGVPHSILTWEREASGAVSQAEARAARHGVLARWADENGIGQIALAHTRDDRLETFLMRARQGSGWYGLCGLTPYAFSPAWPEGAGLRIFRPLLAFGREELRDYLRAREIAWIEDPSNQSSRYERVRMRRLLESVGAGVKQKAINAMDGLAELRMATAEAAFRLVVDHVNEAYDRADIHLDARELVSREAWRRFIDAMVLAAGGSLRPLRGDALDRLLERIAVRDPALQRGVTLGGAHIHIRKGALLTFRRAPPRGGKRLEDDTPPDWGRASQLLYPSNLGSLWV
jgi:tRNA(Ile)-lysidine synthase